MTLLQPLHHRRAPPPSLTDGPLLMVLGLVLLWMPVPHLYGEVDVNASFLVHLQMVLWAVLVHHHHRVDVGVGVSKLQPTFMDDDFMDDDFVGPRSVDQENKKMLEGEWSKE